VLGQRKISVNSGLRAAGDVPLEFPELKGDEARCNRRKDDRYGRGQDSPRVFLNMLVLIYGDAVALNLDTPRH